MVFRSFYSRLVISVGLIILTSLVFCWLVITGQNWILTFHAALLLLLQGWLLVRYTNKWNSELTAFFNRLESGDLVLSSPVLEEFPRLREMGKILKKLSLRLGDERKRFEMENEYFKVLSSNVTTGIIVTDDQNKVLFINPAALHFFGIVTLRHLGNLERHHSGSFSLLGSMETGSSANLAINDGSITRLLMIKLSELVMDNEKMKVFTLEDIEKAIRKNELESWQKLIRVLNHEIMNSISPINSTVQTLSDIWEGMDQKEEAEKKLVDKTLKGLNIIKERGEGLKNFVSAYRSLTTSMTPDLRQVSLHGILQKIVELHQEDMKTGNIQIEVAGEASRSDVRTDPDMLSQALINVLRNAIESFDDENEAKLITIGWKEIGGRWLVFVEDNGKGMPEDVLTNSTIPFYTTKESGSGIGLSLSRQLIPALNGEMRIPSHEGERTKVEFIF